MYCPTYQCMHLFAQLTSSPVSTNLFKNYAQQFQSLTLFCTQLISSVATRVCMLYTCAFAKDLNLDSSFFPASVYLGSVCTMLILNITFTGQNQDWLRISITQVNSLSHLNAHYQASSLHGQLPFDPPILSIKSDELSNCVLFYLR